MKNVPAVPYEINLPVLVEPQEFIEIIQENLQFNFNFDRVQWPTGGVTMFKSTDETGKEVYVEELIGVILYWHPMNVYFSEKFTGEKKQPDCVSYDGKTSINNESCDHCPMNRYGEDGSAKPCKNIYRVYLLKDGESLPVLVSVPPTSRKAFEQYLKFLVQKSMKRYYGVVTRIGLITQQNKQGINYSQAVFSKVADLTKEETKAIKDFAELLKPKFLSFAATSEDYDTSGGSNGNYDEEVSF